MINLLLLVITEHTLRTLFHAKMLIIYDIDKSTRMLV